MNQDCYRGIWKHWLPKFVSPHQSPPYTHTASNKYIVYGYMDNIS